LRGTGLRGLGSLQFFDPTRGLLRPFLYTESREIQEYTKKKKLTFYDDPSNTCTEPFRNWIRQRWLRALDKKRPGAVRVLARSLDVVGAKSNKGKSFAVVDRELNRRDLLQMELSSQTEAIVELFRQNNVNSYTKGQVEEFLKRLDTPQKELIFKVARREWI